VLSLLLIKCEDKKCKISQAKNIWTADIHIASNHSQLALVQVTYEVG